MLGRLAVIGIFLGAPLSVSGDVHDDIEALRRTHNIPVVAYSLWVDGELADARVIGGEQSTQLRWGSITKTVTALTVLALADAGTIDLAAPVDRYADRTHWRNDWAPITVLQLLELSAGFPDLSRVEFDYAEPLSLPAALALNPEHRRTRWPPGLQHGYSNMTPGLSQLVIESSSGKAFADAVAEAVFEPLGMNASSFAPHPDLPGGFREDGSTPIPYWHMTFPAFGALNATLGDLNRLLGALLNKSGLPPSTARHLFTPSTTLAARNGFTFEYAAGLYPRIRARHVWLTHGGDADGYRSRIAFVPEERSGYVAAINIDKPSALRELTTILERYLTRDLERSKVPPVAELSPTELDRFDGVYYPSSTRFRLSAWAAGELPAATVTVDGDRLRFTRSGRSRTLIPVRDGQFRRMNDPVATVAFVTDADGMLYMQGVLGNFARIQRPCPQFLAHVCGADAK